MMDEDILSKDWKHLRTKVRERWHSLSDKDLTIIDGNRNVLVSMLEEKYLYSKDVAEDEVNRFLSEIAPEKQMTHS